MESYKLKYFGNITLKPAKNYETEIKIGKSSFVACLNFYEEFVTIKSLSTVELILKDLPKYIEHNRTILLNDFNKNGQVKDYIDHHPKDLKENENWIDKMKIVSLAFYPDDNKRHTIFYYSIGKEVTDYLITIRFDYNGNFNSLEFVS